MLHRCDRSLATSAKQSGGGSLIAIRDNIPSRRLYSSFNLECIFLLVSLGHNSNLLLGCVYIPPSSPLILYADFCDALAEIIENSNHPKDIFIFGDFNLPDFDLDVNPSALHRRASEQLYDMASIHSLHQLNHIRNRRGVTLDLIFSSHQDIQVTRSLDILIPPDDHHPPLAATLPVQMLASSRDNYECPNLRKCDLPAVFASLQLTDLSFVTQSIPIDDKFEQLKDLLETLSINASPMKRFGNSSFPIWFSGDLKRLIIRKKIAHKRFKNSLNQAHYLEFSGLRNACKELSRDCYRIYLSNVEANISSNPRAFWGLVKAQKNSSDIPSSLHLDGKEANDFLSKCNLFASFFNSVFSPPSHFTADYQFPSFDCLSTISISKDEVLLKLEHLDTKKGAGLDNIPPSVMHHCRSLLAEPLQLLFNESLRKGVFPKALKSGYITPIHKSGDPSNIKNYRPITILPVIGKLFESVVVDKLNFHISKILHPSQHGFVQGKSTVSNLLLFQEYVLAAFRKNKQVDAVYIDMSKAFDKVDHSVLISKLEGYGVADPLLSWISDYLHERSLTVRIGPATSDQFSPSSGVPQGSLLGPCLFNVFINDLLAVVSVNALQFADDLKIFTEISSFEDCFKIQQSLSAIEVWCTRNSMSVNPSKCSTMTFHRIKSPTASSYFISGAEIPAAQTIKDLGVHFDRDMNFSSHINSTCNQANRMLGFISRFSRGITNPSALRALYLSLVRQLVEYASPVWSPYTTGDKTRLEAIQRRFIRLVGVRLGYGFMQVPVEDLSGLLNLPPLALRRDVSDVVLLQKILNGQVQCSDLLAEINFKVPSKTRSRELLSRKHHSTSYDYHSPLARMVRLGNRVATECDFFSDSLQRTRRCAFDLLSI